MRARAIALCLAVLAGDRLAFADDVLPSIDARTLRPSTDPRAGLATEPIVTPGPWKWSVGTDLHLTHTPVVIKNGEDVAYRPLIAVFGGDLLANVGLGKRAAVGLSLPYVLAQGSGDRPLPSSVQTGTVPVSAIGDLGLHAKGAIIRNEAGGFGLATLVGLTLPTGARTSYAGEGSVTGNVRVLAEYSLIILSLQGSLGYQFRTERRTWPDVSVQNHTMGGDPVLRFGDSIPFTLGLVMRPGIIRAIDPGNRQTWEIAVHGWVPAGPVAPFVDPGAPALSPVLMSFSDRIEIGHDHDVYLSLGAELGLSQAVGVPLFRSVVGLGWAPRDHDKDGDRVPDDLDQCPDIPEDRDGFEDTDGCPELDNDDDGIIDREDACPNQKGSRSSDPRLNGCPAPDTDHDGIGDDVDACPKIAGVPSKNPKRNGCPTKDEDGDGVPDDADRCPTQPEDIDGFEDDDGCPDPDNDKDGIQDKDDACPLVPGDPSSDRSRNGCPNPDRDGDTYRNEKDECPDAAEVFNGIKDDDGCPDDGGKPLVTVDAKLNVKLTAPIKFAGTADAPEVDPASEIQLRALALEASKHPDWTLLIGVKPGAGAQAAGGVTEQGALLRAIAVTTNLSRMIQRDGAAESVGWAAVSKTTTADSGVGILVLAAPPPPPPPKK
jgi:hypothetical protein